MATLGTIVLNIISISRRVIDREGASQGWISDHLARGSAIEGRPYCLTGGAFLISFQIIDRQARQLMNGYRCRVGFGRT
jgi:hypothetical protein